MLLFLLLMYNINSVYSGNILIMHPMYAASHVLTMRTLAKSLAQDRHKVDIIRWRDDHAYPEISTPGISEIVMAINNVKGDIPMFSKEAKAKFELPRQGIWLKGGHLSDVPIEGFLAIEAFCEFLLSDAHLYSQLKNKKYDVVIVDLVYNECSLALAYQLGVPVVGYWAFSLLGGEPQYTTALHLPSVNPMIMSSNSDTMTFFQRVKNQFISIFCHFIMQIQFKVSNGVINKYYPNSPHPQELLANLSGLLINSHFAIDYPRLLPPSFVNIGGIQLEEPDSPIEPDLLHFMDNSCEDGFILFTMGFIFDFNYVPIHIVNEYMLAFGKLKQNVLMKAIGISNVTVPENVKIVSWLPQQQILGHRNIKAFITHCGMHGIMESLYHGVPMIGIPIFIDQHDNLVRLIDKGVAIGITKDADSRTIYNSIIEVVNNPMFSYNAKQLSKLLRSDFISPMQKAKWLINHIIDTNGADHLKLSSRHLSDFQIYGLDIILFIILNIIIFFIISKICYRNMLIKYYKEKLL